MLELIVDNGGMKALAAEIGIDRRTVSLALKGATSPRLARKVRTLAILKHNAKKKVELTAEEIRYELGSEPEGCDERGA